MPAPGFWETGLPLAGVSCSMATNAVRGLLALLIVIGFAVPVFAADTRPRPESGYQLSVKSDAFRLTTPGAARNEPPLIPAQFADKPFAAQIQAAALKEALDPALVHAVIHVESRYNPAARSPKGAIGLMQVMPGTALRYGVTDPGQSPETNLRVGTRYLRDLMELFDGRLELVLAAYNAGEKAVMRYGHRIPPYQETRDYVPAVLSKYHEWRDPPSDPGPVWIEYLPGTRFNPGNFATGR